MPAAIPETVKSKVISQWLRGLSKDTIAQDNNISAGAVSNITNEWSIALGKPEADTFRELAKTLTIAGITPAQCAIGFRTMTLLSEQNIDEDVAAQLIIETYKKCKEFEITSSKFATCIKELVKVSDDHQIPLLKVEEYINEKLAKKKELENELENLKSEISTFKNQKSEIENALDLALQQKKMADLEIKSYTNAKQVLDRHNISINEDLPKFANIINRIEAYGYDSKRLIAELKDIQYLGGKKRALEIATKELEESIAKLRQHESLLQDKICLHSENLPVYNQLADMGFGSSQLKTLLDKIINITISNGINHSLAVNKFIDDLETQYNTKLGFEPQIEKLKIEIQNLRKKLEKELQRVKVQPFIGPVITGLLQRGLTEHDILKVADVCHNEISNRTFYAEVLRKGVLYTLQNIMTTSMMKASLIARSTKTTGNDIPI
jgi:hypothetical protein